MHEKCVSAGEDYYLPISTYFIPSLVQEGCCSHMETCV